MTKIQRRVLGVVAAHHLRGRWYRAAGSGERVTLASLCRAGALQRRAWRGEEGAADAAYEYRLTEAAEQALRQALLTESEARGHCTKGLLQTGAGRGGSGSSAACWPARSRLA